MSLRINQNINSLSTYSNLSRSSSRLTSSIEKLSSGLRINSAADDATGLAISEKMRSQIGGLNRAKLNTQDGISMVQTADGGLNETESIIHRMRELAIQGASDSLTSNDRLEIQKEVNQLTSAIDDISNSTEFNTKKLLNGSQTAQISSSSKAVTGLATGAGAVNGDYKVSMAVVQGGISQMQTSQIFTDKNTGNLAKGNTNLEDISQFYDENGVFAFNSAQTLTLTGNSRTSEVSINGKMSLNELAASLQNAISGDSNLGIKNSSVEVVNTATTNISGMGGYLQFTSGAIGEQGNVSFAGEQNVMDALGLSVSRESVNNVVQLRIEDSGGNVRSVNTNSDRASGLLDGIDVQFNSTAAQIAGNGGVVDGLKFDTTETLQFSFYKDATNSVNVNVSFQSGSYSMEAIAGKINATIETAASNTGMEASVVDGQIRIAYHPVNGEASTNIKVTGGNNTLGIVDGTYAGFVDGEKDVNQAVKGISLIDKLADSYTAKVTITDGKGTNKTITVGETVSVVSGTGDLVEAQSFVLKANNTLAAATVNVRVDIVNGSIAFTSTVLGQKNNDIGGATSGDLKLSGSSPLLNNNLKYQDGTAKGSGDTNYRLHVVDNSPNFQIGGNSGQTMDISISNMSSMALGLDKLDMTTSEGASSALEKIDQALSRVSAERSKLGGYSNRLDYTMNNLENTAYNLTNAESRIRDTDMAEEVVEFTSSKIMQEAGTAMLAQSNLLSGSVMSLLEFGE